MDLSRPNLHHLRYFWTVATEGSLTRAAARLRLAPSAVSTQLRQLESQLGVALFRREGRALVLTEAGRLALAYAAEVVRASTDLVTVLEEGRSDDDVLRIGAEATLSRNFQESFVRPLLDGKGPRLRLVSGRFDELVSRLGEHALDVVLTQRSASPGAGLVARRLARQPVVVVGRRRRGFRFPADLQGAPIVLPAPESTVRADFDAWCTARRLRPVVRAEVDDMAALRLLARESGALALVPSIVVRDELRSGRLVVLGRPPGLAEQFFAWTAERRYPHPWLERLLARAPAELLGPGER